MSIIKKNIIDDINLPPLLKSIFSIVEDTYLRKKKYKEDMATLEDRIEILESLINYQFSLSSDGDLSLYIADDANVDANVEITSDGNLVLTEEDDETSQLENFAFSIADDDLSMEVSSSST